MRNKLLENQVAGVNVVSKVEERPRTRRAETMQIYQTPPDKYPTIEWYSEAGFLWSVNCSSTERRTVDNPPRADVNVDAMVLNSNGRIKEKKMRIFNIICI